MTTFAWHVHHDVLVEPLTEPLAVRVRYIKENKPKEEIPLRLKLLKKVKGKLPARYVEARKACDEAGKAYDEAWKAWNEAGKSCDEAWEARNEARKACDKARKACEPAILALHAAECKNCPWDGRTIFAKSV